MKPLVIIVIVKTFLRDLNSIQNILRVLVVLNLNFSSKLYKGRYSEIPTTSLHHQ
jgi:hypothetical protein